MTFDWIKAPLAVSGGAIAGALGRYYLGHWLSVTMAQPGLPVGTLAVNLLGCFGLGLFVSFTRPLRGIPLELRLLIVTGFIGSLTTFSTYILEVVDLIGARNWNSLWIYGVGSPMLGWCSFYGGIRLGENIALKAGLGN